MKSYYCRECDFDLCSGCYTHSNQRTIPALIPDVAMADGDNVFVNPIVMAGLPANFRLFTLAHEHAHNDLTHRSRMRTGKLTPQMAEMEADAAAVKEICETNSNHHATVILQDVCQCFQYQGMTNPCSVDGVHLSGFARAQYIRGAARVGGVYI